VKSGKKSTNGFNSTGCLNMIKKKSLISRTLSVVLLATIFLLLFNLTSLAQEASTLQKYARDNAFVMWMAIFVFLMGLGYSLWNTKFHGSKQKKWFVKNLSVLGLSVLICWALGFSFMAAPGTGNSFIGGGGWFLTGHPRIYGLGEGEWLQPSTFFLYYAATNVTVAAIIFNAIAERVKFLQALVFILLSTGFTYPAVSYWIWNGGGWLYSLGFTDFAGSTVIFSVSGWAALAAVLVFSPTQNRNAAERFETAQGASSTMYFSFLILCSSWIALNTVSELAFTAAAIRHIAITSISAAIGGTAGAVITGWIYSRRYKSARAMHGALSGLAAISAACHGVSVTWALEIGFLSSILVFFVFEFLIDMNIDSLSGMISVHLAGGIWGTLSAGLFTFHVGLFVSGNPAQLFVQFLGVCVVGIFTFLVSCIFAFAIKFFAVDRRLRID
jgi:Amt family ammonium transporter